MTKTSLSLVLCCLSLALLTSATETEDKTGVQQMSREQFEQLQKLYHQYQQNMYHNMPPAGYAHPYGSHMPFANPHAAMHGNNFGMPPHGQIPFYNTPFENQHAQPMFQPAGNPSFVQTGEKMSSSSSSSSSDPAADAPAVPRIQCSTVCHFINPLEELATQPK
eukprot:GILK01005310.1.p1 GENE.GILK01005310.1~~GILK01005310.1.p1  ORF type:complete len:178 (-),score=33.95 GILK01005310.1:115-606(-)